MCDIHKQFPKVSVRTENDGDDEKKTPLSSCHGLFALASSRCLRCDPSGARSPSSHFNGCVYFPENPFSYLPSFPRKADRGIPFLLSSPGCRQNWALIEWVLLQGSESRLSVLFIRRINGNVLFLAEVKCIPISTPSNLPIMRRVPRGSGATSGPPLESQFATSGFFFYSSVGVPQRIAGRARGSRALETLPKNCNYLVIIYSVKNDERHNDSQIGGRCSLVAHNKNET